MGIDTQDQEPKIKAKIDRVGIENLKTNLKVQGKSGDFSHSPSIDVMISLGKNRKGVHMSRLIEAINAVISHKSKREVKSLERFGNEVLREIENKHPYQKGEIKINTTLILDKKTPASNKESTEHYDVTVTVTRRKNKVDKYLEVTVIGATACPHSLNLTNGKTHIQRSKISLGILTNVDSILPLEALIKIAENSFSAPTFSVVKSEDERALVKQIYKNPKFVEDVARECLSRTKKLGIKGEVHIRVVSYESIHKHNAVAQIIREI